MRVFSKGSVQIDVYPRDHDPVHCHVDIENGKYRFRVYLPDYSIDLVDNSPLPPTAMIREILDLVKSNRTIIGQTWRRFHGN
jgi:hypothetical protein